MVKITSYEDSFFHPPLWEGLEEVVRFPDGEVRNHKLPNSTLWAFSAEGHQYRTEILGNDVGCGMTAFFLKDIDHRKAAEAFYAFLKDKRAIGGGNHFIDICAPIESFADIRDNPYKILLIHTHGPDKSVPETFEQAQQRQLSAESFRSELGEELSALVESPCEMFGNWTHNSVAIEEGKVIYRKGVVKAESGKIHVLPAHLGAKILLYAINDQSPPPYFSMPHATGRKGPVGDTKVEAGKAEMLRQLVYIPSEISPSSLRSVHPSCYNGYDKIMEKLHHENGFFIPLGETKILSYVGKV